MRFIFAWLAVTRRRWDAVATLRAAAEAMRRILVENAR